jgi:hypothetical protein
VGTPRRTGPRHEGKGNGRVDLPDQELFFAQAADGGFGRPVHDGGIGQPVRRTDPGRSEIEQRPHQLRVVDLLAILAGSPGGQGLDLRRRSHHLARPVGRQGVLRFPPLQDHRKLQDLGVGFFDPLQVLPPHHPLGRQHSSDLGRRDERAQLGKLVG